MVNGRLAGGLKVVLKARRIPYLCAMQAPYVQQTQSVPAVITATNANEMLLHAKFGGTSRTCRHCSALHSCFYSYRTQVRNKFANHSMHYFTTTSKNGVKNTCSCPSQYDRITQRCHSAVLVISNTDVSDDNVSKYYTT